MRRERLSVHTWNAVDPTPEVGPDLRCLVGVDVEEEGHSEFWNTPETMSRPDSPRVKARRSL